MSKPALLPLATTVHRATRWHTHNLLETALCSLGNINGRAPTRRNQLAKVPSIEEISSNFHEKSNNVDNRHLSTEDQNVVKLLSIIIRIECLWTPVVYWTIKTSLNYRLTKSTLISLNYSRTSTSAITKNHFDIHLSCPTARKQGVVQVRLPQIVQVSKSPAWVISGQS